MATTPMSNLATTTKKRRTSTGSESPADPTPTQEPAVQFDFAFDRAFRAAGLAFGITPGRTGVVVDSERLTVRFGMWRVSTPLANVLSAHVTGPYNPLKVIGGPRLSLGDRGLTFATNAHQGVCIGFVRPVKGIDPLGRIAHPGLTVTVADAPALAELLERAGDRHGAQAVDEPVPVAELVQETADELSGLTAAELRTRARDLGLTGVAKLRKAELIELLEAPEPTSD